MNFHLHIQNLSKVYRHVLQHKDEELVNLKTELDFIYAFTQLLKKRHGDRIHFNFNISAKDHQKKRLEQFDSTAA